MHLFLLLLWETHVDPPVERSHARLLSNLDSFCCYQSLWCVWLRPGSWWPHYTQTVLQGNTDERVMRLSPFEKKQQQTPTVISNRCAILHVTRLYVSMLCLAAVATWTWSSWKALNSRITTQAELFLSPLTFDPLYRALCWQIESVILLLEIHMQERGERSGVRIA